MSGPNDLNIQWFPGHMTKTLRMMKANLALVDAVVELLDARVPYSSKNPNIDELAQTKRRLLILNKADLAEPSATTQWAEHYRRKGFAVMAANAHDKKIVGLLANALNRLMHEKIQKEKQRGKLQATIRAMVVGIPNVGKSTFINQLAGSAKTAVADRPGVTRGKQWIKLKNFDIMDTPGVLWPKFDEPQVGENLAFTGAITDNVLDAPALCEKLIYWLLANKPGALSARYKIEEDSPSRDSSSQDSSSQDSSSQDSSSQDSSSQDSSSQDSSSQDSSSQDSSSQDSSSPDSSVLPQILESIGIARGCKLKGGVTDIERTAVMLLDEFRAGKLGRVTLDSYPASLLQT